MSDQFFDVEKGTAAQDHETALFRVRPFWFRGEWRPRSLASALLGVEKRWGAANLRLAEDRAKTEQGQTEQGWLLRSGQRKECPRAQRECPRRLRPSRPPRPRAATGATVGARSPLAKLQRPRDRGHAGRAAPLGRRAPPRGPTEPRGARSAFGHVLLEAGGVLGRGRGRRRRPR